MTTVTQPVTPAPRTSGKCLFCNSHKCYTRIYTKNLGYDELACDKHIKQLEAHADETLGSPGTIRMHLSSTGKLMRGIVSEEDWKLCSK